MRPGRLKTRKRFPPWVLEAGSLHCIAREESHWWVKFVQFLSTPSPRCTALSVPFNAASWRCENAQPSETSARLPKSNLSVRC